MRPYYLRYDDHYRSLYDQGFQYWADGPDHCRKNIEMVTALLTELLIDPNGLTVLDVGCGEGHLAVPIAELGLTYTGIDVSPEAIKKARDRAGHDTIRFEVADAVTADASAFETQYDVVLDQQCYHMLVVDADSRRYLSNIRQILGRDSLFLLLMQGHQANAYDGPITTVEKFQTVFQHDLREPKRWEVWHDEGWIDVTLPSFGCRLRTKKAYLRELKQAGFSVQQVREHSKGNALDFVLKKGTKAVNGQARA